MKLQFNKPFVVSGLVMIFIGLLAPMAHKHAAAPFGLLQAHLIGEVQALLFFTLAVIWPVLNLPKLSLWIGDFSLQLGLWTNMIGTLFIGILGAGKEQYIVNQDKIPGYQGFWNDVTNLLIALSAYAAITIVIALIGVLRKQSSEASDKVINAVSVALFVLLGIFVVFQVMFPEYSNL
jgi:hydroxylaminobenzene mutase